MLYKEEVRYATIPSQTKTEVCTGTGEDFLICLKKAIHLIEKRYPQSQEGSRWQE